VDCSTYPPHWEADVVASDGRTVHLRPIVPADADALLAFHSRLSERTRYLRYFGPYPRIPDRDLHRFTHVDHHSRAALVAVLGDDIIGVGRYEGLGPESTSAEVAFVIEDAHQGRGLGTILLEHLAAAARERGLRRFTAEVLAENRAMVRIFLDAGYQVSREFDSGVLHLEFDIDPTEQSIAVGRAREHRAEARSMHNVMHPRSVAVIGASSDRTKIGHAVLRNLLAADPPWPVYPVNPEHRSVRGVRAYRSVTEIPDDVDLAVVTVPPASVDDVVDDCLAKGVRALVVVTSGLVEPGGDQAAAERRLVSLARAHGMRVVGPAALGVVNLDPTVRLNASLAPELPKPGRVGFFCQSGALGTAILAAAAERGLGLSTFVSAGNRADVSGNDLLQYWESDPDTDVVLLLLESFGNPRKFARLARRVAAVKPVVAVKSGRHGGSLPRGLAANSVAVDDASVEAMFEQAGVIRVDTSADLFDTALLLAHQPLPAVDSDPVRVAVVGNSTALGVLAADAALERGLGLAGEPVDVGVAAPPEALAEAVARQLARPDVHALVAVFVPPVAVAGTAYARALREVTVPAGKPVVSTFLGAEGILGELAVPSPTGAPGRGSVPSYASPERAVAALARAARYARWRQRPAGRFDPPSGVDGDAAVRLVEEIGAAGAPVELTDGQTLRLLGCAGLTVAPFETAADPDSAVAAAARLGYPVAVKAEGAHWRHRGDLIGVRLDLGTPDAVRTAYQALTEISSAPEVIVQRMAAKGTSCTFAVQDDPSFGSVLSFGLTGVVSDLLGDRAYRVLPLSDADARDLVAAPRAAPLLSGYGGAEPVDMAALVDVARRIAWLADSVPTLRALSLQPVLASPSGAAVISATAAMGPPPTRGDSGPRRLRSPS
jgi:acyl-CoA synthetase (NDP forming)/RimJ/RimL family protein N-acetyltransferase